ncbi:MAG TPA: MFS transporter [Chloroflexota bacterium]|nr:MFS transporter [Chloroflexota bacterium]
MHVSCRRPSGLATLQTLGTIPNVLIMLFGGLAADRFRPHRVVFVSMLMHTVIAGLIAPLALLGLLAYWHLVVFTLLGGVAGGLFNGSFFAVLPDLLPAGQLRSANALSSMTESISCFLIPPLADLTLSAAGTPPALALGAAMAFVTGAIIGSIRLAPREAAGGAGPEPEPCGVVGVGARSSCWAAC